MKTAVITGASAGLGREFARFLAQRGYKLYIVARRIERLEELAEKLRDEHNVEVVPLKIDLTREEERDVLLSATGPNIDLLVNNAGFGQASHFSEQKRRDAMNMIALNTSAVADLTHLYLPGMIERRSGEIVIVASIAAFQPVPYFSVYAATKGFDLLFAEALYYELKPKGIHVLALCPGATRTEFGEVAGTDPGIGMSATSVVRATLKGLDRKKRIVIPGIGNKCMVLAQKMTPRGVVNMVTLWMFRRFVS